LDSFKKVEFYTLVEELASIFVANLFNGNLPKDWAKQALKWIDKHPKRKEGWTLHSILGIHLHDVSLWESLTARERLTVSRAIVGYLAKHRN